jgi:anthranilate synthase component 2
MSSDKILIVDFEDSFTYNIASVLFPYENKLRVISHREFFQTQFSDIVNSKEKLAVIFGPGPGHPENHSGYFEAMRILREKENIYVMGICLGHQMLGLMDGMKVDRALELKHGQTVEMEVSGQLEKVQRYNSLALYETGSEVNVRHFPRGVSYQFHPESIGTPKNAFFFQDLLEFIQLL